MAEVYSAGHDHECVVKHITQASHGFSVGDAVYYDTTGAAYAKSKADAAATAECEGIVSAVNGNDFTLTLHGWITGLSGLTAGEQYVSPTTAGALTTTEPSTAGHVSKPVMFAVSSSGGYVNIMRGMVIASSSVATHASSHSSGQSDAISHNNLAGLNSGDYQHLTAAQATDLTDGGETTLHSHSATGGGGGVFDCGSPSAYATGTPIIDCGGI